MRFSLKFSSHLSSLFLNFSPFFQVLLVGFGTLYFGDNVGLLNGLGIIIVIIGSFRYSSILYRKILFYIMLHYTIPYHVIVNTILRLFNITETCSSIVSIYVTFFQYLLSSSSYFFSILNFSICDPFSDMGLLALPRKGKVLLTKKEAIFQILLELTVMV